MLPTWTADSTDITADGAYLLIPGYEWTADGAIIFAPVNLPGWRADSTNITADGDYILTDNFQWTADGALIGNGPTIMPLCIGLTWYEGCIVLMDNDLIAVPPIYQPSLNVIPGIITGQSIPAGTPVANNQPITFYVAGNPYLLAFSQGAKVSTP
jgi:hypothetical protein